MPDRCRSCKAPIAWAISSAGKPSPIDVAPVEDGNTLLVKATGWESQLIAVVLTGSALATARQRGVKLRKSHWATCVDRQEWRERTDRKAAQSASG